MNLICIEFPEVIDVRCVHTGKVWTVNQENPIRVPDGDYEISCRGMRLDFMQGGKFPGFMSNPVRLRDGDTFTIRNIKYAK